MASPDDHAHLTTWEQIQQTLQQYPIAVDTKQIQELFPKIFAPDAFGNYGGPLSNLQGLQSITGGIAASTAKMGTHHHQGTAFIQMLGPEKAAATTYITATLFGTGDKEGKQVQLYGYYKDTLVLLKGEGWRIKTRELIQLGAPSGDQSVLGG